MRARGELRLREVVDSFCFYVRIGDHHQQRIYEEDHDRIPNTNEVWGILAGSDLRIGGAGYDGVSGDVRIRTGHGISQEPHWPLAR